jgi:hypothetical protein
MALGGEKMDHAIPQNVETSELQRFRLRRDPRGGVKSCESVASSTGGFCD